MTWQVMLLSIVSSGLSATIVGGFFTWWVGKKIDFQQRVMEKRKEIYSDTVEALAGLYDTASAADRTAACNSILALHRQAQLWGSTAVVQQFNNLMQALDLKNGLTQSERNTKCTNLILAMRSELSRERIAPAEIHRYGKII